MFAKSSLNQQYTDLNHTTLALSHISNYNITKRVTEFTRKIFVGEIFAYRSWNIILLRKLWCLFIWSNKIKLITPNQINHILQHIASSSGFGCILFKSSIVYLLWFFTNISKFSFLNIGRALAVHARLNAHERMLLMPT